jgi:hypothetical protein
MARQRPTTISTTVRIQTEERRKHEKEVARQALELAHTSVHTAMDFIRNSMPDKFLAHSSWYERTKIIVIQFIILICVVSGIYPHSTMYIYEHSMKQV